MCFFCVFFFFFFFGGGGVVFLLLLLLFFFFGGGGIFFFSSPRLDQFVTICTSIPFDKKNHSKPFFFLQEVTFCIFNPKFVV